MLSHCFQISPRSISSSNTKNEPQSSQLLAEAPDEQRQSSITSWVVENLEDANSTITTRSTVQAGENDTLPMEGLLVGKTFRVLAADAPLMRDDARTPIRLYLGRNGWGTGVHPSTRLCLEWLEDQRKEQRKGNNQKTVLLDYGCGSGILSIAALQLGVAQSCIGVDVEAEALVTAERNVELNGLRTSNDDDVFEPYHTREILPYMFQADLCTANILIGQLVRPSMVAAIVSNLKSGGLVCFSGIRPGAQVESLQQAYADALEWVDEDAKSLEARDTEGSIASYGFDCGAWSRVVGRKKDDTGRRQAEIDAMSELAVS